MTNTIPGERIRRIVRDRVPGIAVLVVDPEDVRAAGEDELADIAEHIPASSQMVCPWFSMTRIATATTAMRLVERGILRPPELIEPHGL